MLVIPGYANKDTCDGITRRELLRVGGSAIMGLSLANILGLQKAQANTPAAGGGPGFGKAKSVILIYLQGGPSHLDLWDPKENVPDNVKSVFKPIATKLPGVQFTEILPKLAQQVTDKATLIRSMSYTPIGLFNHTAAIYQMLTGYTTDKVSPSGQLEPPTPKDFPNVGCNIARLKPPTVPMLPFVMMPRPLQESNVVGKGGTAGFLGRAYDPYYPLPDRRRHGHDARWSDIKVDDLQLRAGSVLEASGAAGEPARRHQRRACRSSTRPPRNTTSTNTTARRSAWCVSGKARDAFDLSKEPAALRERYGKNTFGQCCLLARRLIEAGTRFVEVNWPKVANSRQPLLGRARRPVRAA